MSFHLQFRAPPKHVLQTELRALRAFLPGPGYWFAPEDAFLLKAGYGFSVAFDSLQDLSVASRIQALHAEPGSRRHAIAEIQEAWATSPHSTTEWHHWYHDNLFVQQAMAQAHFEEKVGPLSQVLRQLASHAPSADRRGYVKRMLQHTLRVSLLRPRSLSVHRRISSKLTRCRSAFRSQAQHGVLRTYAVHLMGCRLADTCPILLRLFLPWVRMLVLPAGGLFGTDGAPSVARRSWWRLAIFVATSPWGMMRSSIFHSAQWCWNSLVSTSTSQ